MRRTALVIVSVLLGGCAALDQKRENYQRVADMAVNPEQIKIIYERKGDVSTFMETRCTGALCETLEN